MHLPHTCSCNATGLVDGTVIAVSDMSWSLRALDGTTSASAPLATGLLARASHSVQPSPPLAGITGPSHIVAVSGHGDVVVYAGATALQRPTRPRPASAAAATLALFAQAKVHPWACLTCSTCPDHTFYVGGASRREAATARQHDAHCLGRASAAEFIHSRKRKDRRGSMLPCCAYQHEPSSTFALLRVQVSFHSCRYSCKRFERSCWA